MLEYALGAARDSQWGTADAAARARRNTIIRAHRARAASRAAGVICGTLVGVPALYAAHASAPVGTGGRAVAPTVYVHCSPVPPAPAAAAVPAGTGERCGMMCWLDVEPPHNGWSPHVIVYAAAVSWMEDMRRPGAGPYPSRRYRGRAGALAWARQAMARWMSSSGGSDTPGNAWGGGSAYCFRKQSTLLDPSHTRNRCWMEASIFPAICVHVHATPDSLVVAPGAVYSTLGPPNPGLRCGGGLPW